MPPASSQSKNSTSIALDSEPLVRVENVSKIFCRDFKKSLKYGLADSTKDLMCWTRRRGKKVAESTERELRPGEFNAVKDVSFEIKRGECLGLIGHNGAGKTTLLKMLNGLIKPDSGRIEMRGRVGAVIALGAGFNPLLTGRENIFVNGSVLGLSKSEISDKIDEIIDFSGIGKFIDSPVQSYSSGMQVRLGFAVATAIEPHILILDEVLAVGDTSFKVKCLNRMSELKKRCAMIFVSHDALQVSRICSKAIWMNQGRQIQSSSDVQGILSSYEAEIGSIKKTETPGTQVGPGNKIKAAVDGKTLDPKTPERFDATVPHSLSVFLPPVIVEPGIKEYEIRISLLDSSHNPVTTLKCSKGQRDFLIQSQKLKESLRIDIELSLLPLSDGIFHIRVSLGPFGSSSDFTLFQDSVGMILAYGRGREWSRISTFGEFSIAVEG